MPNDLMRMENSPEPIELNYAATMDGLFAALRALEQACNNWKIDTALVSRALIVVEELFSNTIKYGYGGECAKPVRLRLQPLPLFTITYEDDAPLFDPTNWKLPPDEGLGERSLGLAGIAMVVGLCADVTYQPRDGGNRLVLTFGT
jgi:anti-sigma regulatory factor (Ser/Thr protein kinase)